MKSMCPYLFFNGNCKQAIEYYKKTFGGELKIMTVGDTKNEMFKDKDQNLVMHATLMSAKFQIMASDNMQKDTKGGDNVCIEIECSDRAELDKLYGALSEGGDPYMKPQDTFWGAYFGGVTDAFGISWLLNFR